MDDIQEMFKEALAGFMEDSLFKMLYLAMKGITKKWTGRRQEWSQIYAQLVICYGDRIPE